MSGAFRGWLTALAALSVSAALTGAQTRFVFGNPEASATSTKAWAGTNGWENLSAAKAALDRQGGVGLAANAASGMIRRFETPERLVSLAITCSTGGTTAAGKVHTVGVRFGAEAAFEALGSFETGAVGTQVTVSRIFEAPIEASEVAIVNLDTQSGYFEVAEVAWQDAFEPISVALAGTRLQQGVDMPLNAALSECSGGSGSYTRFSWSFAGQTVETSTPSEVAPFRTPLVDGTYTLGLEVEDSMGTVADFSWEVRVLPCARADVGSFTVSNRTRFGFDFAWEQTYTQSISKYVVRVGYAEAAAATVSELLMPAWVQEEGRWRLESPIALLPYTQGRSMTAYLLPQHWEPGGLEVSLDGEAWRAVFFYSTAQPRYVLGALPAGAQVLDISTTAPSPPPFLRLCLNPASNTVASVTLPAEGAERFVSFTNLPAGVPLTVSVYTHYDTDDGGTLAMYSGAFAVAATEVPPVADFRFYPAAQALLLRWPEGESALPGEVSFYAQRLRAETLPEGLYLSRLYFAGAPLEVCKAIVISNTANYDIALDGRYALLSATGSGESLREYTWDFSVSERDEAGEARLTYPYIVPAGGECLFYAKGYTAPPGAENFPLAYGVSTEVLRYLNAAYTLSFLKDGQPRASLTPQKNAVLRLQGGSTEVYEALDVPESPLTLPALETPWALPNPQVKLGTLTFASGPSQMPDCSAYLAQTEGFVRIWAQARLRDGSAYSEPRTLVLWEQPRRRALRLRLH